MSAYIKKMEREQKQHAFPVVAWCQSSDSRTSSCEFQIQRSQQKKTPCGVVILCNQPGHVSPRHTGVKGIKSKGSCPKTAPLAAATGAQWFWNQNTHLAPGGHGWVPVSNHDSASEDSNNLGIKANLENRGEMSTFKAGQKPLGLGCVNSSAHLLSSLFE